ncbi:MAG TPA: aldo/keto reductase [Bacteroidota bacterium]|nr:aldo/keto reductase [Bacteroidota bacterium]
MHYRTLGRTQLHVSEVGFGAWGIGGSMWQGSDDDESLNSLHRAADLGVNVIDTALAYGRGHSERLVGKFLKDRKERFVIATKIPPRNGEWPAKGTIREAFPYNYIIECTEQSLKNLNVDVLDVQQLHVWDDSWTDDSEWYDALCELRDDGKIRFFGVSINDHQSSNALRVGSAGKVDTFQVIYNIFDRSPEDDLFILCQKQNIGVIARVPFDEGSLTGSITPETTFPEKDWRNEYFRGDRKREVFDRVEKLKALLGDEAKSLPELSLRFCLNHRAVSTVIPGMRTVKHVEENCSVSDGKQLSEHLIAELCHHQWQRNFYD